MLLLPDCVKVARQTLTLFVWVRILVGQPPVPSPFDSSEGILNGMWLSLVERCVRDAEVAGSNPVIPTNKKDAFGRFFCWSGCGERNPFCRFDSPGPDRMRREDPLMVLPSHNPLLCVGEGFYIFGASSAKTAAWASFLLAGMRGAHTFLQIW